MNLRIFGLQSRQSLPRIIYLSYPRVCILPEVEEFLGHSSVRTTERYIHPDREERKKAVELLCKKQPKSVQKGANLLHIRYMKRDDKDFRPASSLFSAN